MYKGYENYISKLQNRYTYRMFRVEIDNYNTERSLNV